ncbi:MAG: hypothetical protein AAF571_10930 [Verrucomicrobiota bacterium]
MNYVLVGYLCIFCLIYLVLLAIELFLTPADEREPVLTSVIDYSVAAILATGMIFLAIDFPSGSLRLLWGFLAPAAALSALFMSYRDRKAQLESTAVQTAGKWFAFTDFGTLFLIIPALVLNLIWVFNLC